MKPWENGYAYPANAKIQPEPAGMLVDYSPELNPVAEGPVKFRRSESDETWAVKVLPRGALLNMMASFDGVNNITESAHELIVAEAATIIDSARLAPGEVQREKHLEFGRVRLSNLARVLKSTQGRVGTKVVRRHLDRL